LPHEGLDRRLVMLNQVGDPEGAAGSQSGVSLAENGFPFVLWQQVMQDGRGQDDIELAVVSWVSRMSPWIGR